MARYCMPDAPEMDAMQRAQRQNSIRSHARGVNLQPAAVERYELLQVRWEARVGGGKRGQGFDFRVQGSGFRWRWQARVLGGGLVA